MCKMAMAPGLYADQIFSLEYSQQQQQQQLPVGVTPTNRQTHNYFLTSQCQSKRFVGSQEQGMLGTVPGKYYGECLRVCVWTLGPGPMYATGLERSPLTLLFKGDILGWMHILGFLLIPTLSLPWVPKSLRLAAVGLRSCLPLPVVVQRGKRRVGKS